MAADKTGLMEIYNRFQPPLDNPSVTISFTGFTEGVIYTYVVTAVGDTGETNGMLVSVEGSGNLSSTNYITLSWIGVKNAKKYRVYGRTSMGLGLLVETTKTSWMDYGTAVPDTSKRPPIENTTGRLDWESLEFLPGRSLQSAELNEVQSVLSYHLERLGRTLFNDGDVVSGCSLTVSGDKTTVYISDGKVFVRGRVRNISGSSLSITGSGTEVIGLKVIEEYEDAADDPILLDPAQGYPGYATQGALRKVLKLEWVKDDPDAIPVYELYNGSLKKDYTITRYSELEKALAVRTWDISGDVIVSGLDLVIKDHSERRDKVVFRLNSGKAYVNGYEVFKPMPVEWKEDTAVGYDTVSVEVIEPRESGSYVYEVDSSPVKRVISVTGSFFKSVSGTVPSATDANGWYVWNFPEASIDEVVGVWDTSAKGREYVLNSDYRIEGNSLKFNPNTFSPGQSFYVEYYYFRELVKGSRSLGYREDTFNTDGVTTNFTTTMRDVINHEKYPVVVQLEDSGGNVLKVYRKDEFSVDLNRSETGIGQAVISLKSAPSSGNVLRIKYYYWVHDVEGEYVSVDSYLDSSDPFQNYLYNVVDNNIVDLRTGGGKPNKSTLYVRYEYFLPQYAYLLLDKDGNVEVLRGVAKRSPDFPVKPVGKLVLYKLYFPAFASAGEIVFEKQSDYNRFTVYDMNRLSRRVDKIHYDLALTYEELDALGKETPSPKKAIFADSFTDAEKLDYDNSLFSMDTVEGELKLPVNVQTQGLSVKSANVRFSSGVALKTYTSQEWIIQPVWTEDGVLSLNPYGAVGLFGVCEIYPNQDFWYEKKTYSEIANRVNLTYTADWWEMVSVSTLIDMVARTLAVDPGRVLLSSSAESSFTFTVEGQTVFAYAYYYPELRQIVIYFRLFSLPLTDFEVYFGGVKASPGLVMQTELDNLKLGWVSKGSSGDTVGSLKTSGDGWLTGKFTIPSGISAGEQEVEFKSVDGRVYCSTKFVGMGRVDVFKKQNTLVTVNVVRSLPPWWGWNLDPLAQTFIAPEDGFIESIDLWFYGVPAEEQLFSVVIREVSQGIPTTVELGRSSKTKSEILLEAKLDTGGRILRGLPSETNGRVRFYFDPSVFVQGGKEYAVCLDNSAPGFFVLGARVGKKVLVDLSGERTVGSVLDTQAHDGVCLFSVNARTWESYQDVDLMFRINRAVFNTGEQSIEFHDINWSPGIGEMISTCQVLLPAKTTLIWEWSSDGVNWSVYKPVVSLVDADWEEEDDKVLLGKLVSSLKLRCKFRTNSDRVSPVLKMDSLRVFGGWYDGSGIYESKNVSLIGGSDFTNIKIWFWFDNRGGNIDSVKVSFDGGTVWYDAPYVINYVVVSNFKEYEYGGNLNMITDGTLTEADKFKIRVEFSGSDVYRSCVFKKMRVIVY